MTWPEVAALAIGGVVVCVVVWLILRSPATYYTADLFDDEWPRWEYRTEPYDDRGRRVVPDTDPWNMDAPSARCYVCGAFYEYVKPGKQQPTCECAYQEVEDAKS